MDFMIDDCLKPWLIEINTNPCLELSCPLLERIIPSLVEQVFRYFYYDLEFALILYFLPLRSGPLTKKCLLATIF